MCCNDKIEKVDLKNDKLANIKMNINKSQLQFFPYDDYGIFKLINGPNVNINSPELNGLENKISQLKEDINDRNKRIELLKNKVEEIDEKIDAMNKKLNIDVSEKDYITELGNKIGKPNLEKINDF